MEVSKSWGCLLSGSFYKDKSVNYIENKTVHRNQNERLDFQTEKSSVLVRHPYIL